MKTIATHLLPYHAFLTEEKKRAAQKITQFEQENRQDEADLMKIRLNIYGVFETIAQADEKASSDWEDFCLRYEQRFETLTAPWKQRLASAVRNSDSRTRFTEEIKLSTAAAIQKAFLAAKECSA